MRRRQLDFAPGRREHARVQAGEGLDARVASIRRAIVDAATRVGRDPAAVRIVAITKTHPPETVRAALAAGLDDIGENYVQEGREKRARVPGGTWHLVGGLQRNKVRQAVAAFDWIETVDSLPLAEAVGAEAERLGRRMPVLVQVNVAADPGKRGVAPGEAIEVLCGVAALPGLRLEGLMTIPDTAGDPAASRPHFRALRALRDRARDRLGVELANLSMGMSNDFLIAVEEGATLVRIGHALFGARGPRSWREGA